MLDSYTQAKKPETEPKSLVSEYDIYSLTQASHYHAHIFLGAQLKAEGVQFSFWHPDISAVSVVGDFNNWSTSSCPMTKVHESGIWSTIIEGIGEGASYQYALHHRDGHIELINDPYAFQLDFSGRLASVVINRNKYEWSDQAWIKKREAADFATKPLSILSFDLKSHTEKQTYQELAKYIFDQANNLCATHIELEGFLEEVNEFDAEGKLNRDYFYFSPSAVFGKADDFKCLVDFCHRNNLGVILKMPDFFKNAFEQVRVAEHKNFFLSNLVYWLEEHHIDGFSFSDIRDLSYRVSDGKKIDFIQTINETIHARASGVFAMLDTNLTIPYITKPTYMDGLGFNMKVSKIFADTCSEYFSELPDKRDLDKLLFLSVPGFAENHALVVNNDLNKRVFEDLKILLGLYFTFPGKKYLSQETLCLSNLVHKYINALNLVYTTNSPLYESDFKDSCFEWLNYQGNQLSFIRWSKDYEDMILVLINFDTKAVQNYRSGVPKQGLYTQLFNSDAREFVGTGMSNEDGIYSSNCPSHQRPYSIVVDLPAQSISVFKLQDAILVED